MADHILSIDIETYSEAPLPKCGLYRYMEDPSFEILLIGYALDDDPVTVLDLTSGDSTAEFEKLLYDPAVIKSAFNAAFERTGLAKHFGRECPAEQWQDTMILASYAGLPRSLKQVGEALRLGEGEAKLGIGETLIRYFSIPCKPSNANGHRTRNLPMHDRNKWHQYIEYNRRDVETERTIRKRLSKFAFPPQEQKLWVMDQAINDRGVMIDRTLAENAVRMATENQERLIEEAKLITHMDNPNSLSQLKEWLGVSSDAELRKKDVANLLATETDTVTRRMLEIRQELGKTSVKKYAKMLEAANSDDRVRGTTQFYKANRTGRWCLTGDHEVLTHDRGWVRLDEWEGGDIACWGSTQFNVGFAKAEKLEFDYEGLMYTYSDVRIEQCSTPDHKMRVKRSFEAPWQDMTVEEMSNISPIIPILGYGYHRGCASPAWLRVLIMTQADGHYTLDGSVKYHFKKQRKIERCKHLLRKAEIPFVVQPEPSGAVTVRIPARCVPLWLRQFRSKTFGYWLLDENPDIFFDELPNWDGYYPAPNSIQYSTCNKQNADIVQALAHMSGRCANVRLKKCPENKSWQDTYVVDIWLNPSETHTITKKPTFEHFKGKVYCASTKTGYFLVRRNGKVWVTGNSGSMIQPQNLPRNSIEDLDTARELVRKEDTETLVEKFGSLPDTLSQLIRTAIIPKPGCVFAVADFSAIEARVLAWLAGEEWRLEAFRGGKDIYCESASAMFHVPVVKHGINGELRQKGKVAELACGYSGGVGALKAMGALDMGIPEEELQGIIARWREASPNIVRFWWNADAATKAAVRKRGTQQIIKGPVRIPALFRTDTAALAITLPSGRSLHYCRPKLGTNRFGGESITYEGNDAGHWGRLETYGGRFAENLTQAIARDCLALTMLRVTKMGYNIVFHVHDEMIVEVEKEKADQALADMLKAMSDPMPWAPDLPLKGDGYLCNYYKKD